jgi:hypothetical protein
LVKQNAVLGFHFGSASASLNLRPTLMGKGVCMGMNMVDADHAKQFLLANTGQYSCRYLVAELPHIFSHLTFWSQLWIIDFFDQDGA